MLRNEGTPFYLRAATKAGGHQEKVSYPWLFFHLRRTFVLGFLTTCLVGGGAFLLFLWYVRTGHKAEARSPFGVWYGILGTGFLAASAIGFSVRRRQRPRRVGSLNGVLLWHIFLAFMGILILAMHSFGHLQQVSGTAALLSLLVLCLSGVVGKVLDHVIPRLLAKEVARALTSQGEDLSTAAERLINMEQAETPSTQRMKLPMNVLQYAVQGSAQALQREQQYRAILRYWRIIHIALAAITISTTCWHILHAIQVLLGT